MRYARPSWIILSPSTSKALRSAAESAWRAQTPRTTPREVPWAPGPRDDGKSRSYGSWGVLRGRKGWTALYNAAQGSQLDGMDIASAISMALPGRHHLLMLDGRELTEDEAETYEGGELVGRMGVRPAGRIAVHLGCKVPGLVDADHEPVESGDFEEYDPPPRSAANEPAFFGPTVRQWIDMLEHGTADELEGVFEATGAREGLLDALQDDNADLRFVAASLLSMVHDPEEGWSAAVEAALENERVARIRAALSEALTTWCDDEDT